MFQQPCQ